MPLVNFYPTWHSAGSNSTKPSTIDTNYFSLSHFGNESYDFDLY